MTHNRWTITTIESQLKRRKPQGRPKHRWEKQLRNCRGQKDAEKSGIRILFQ